MSRPPILLLQFLNVLIAAGGMATFAVAAAVWSAHQWPALVIGAVAAVACLCYALPVAAAGRLADRWGRPRTAMVGATIGAIAIAVPVLWPTPVAAVVAVLLSQGAQAVFFPANAGLFAEVPSAAPLHQRVSRYNLGWSSGCFLGFILAGVLAELPARASFALCAGLYLLVVLLLWRWRALPAGQRASTMPVESPHPALAAFARMHRWSLLLACVGGFALITQFARAVAPVDLPPAEAEPVVRRLQGWYTVAYSGGYILVFALLGAWTGWILRPGRMLALQSGLVIGTGLLAWWSWSGEVPTWGLSLCGALVGIGFGHTYTGSLYYSLRLPVGASRAAGLHETFLGVGNTIGPILGGAVCQLALLHGGPGCMLPALALLACVCFVAVLALQAAAWRRLSGGSGAMAGD